MNKNENKATDRPWKLHPMNGEIYGTDIADAYPHVCWMMPKNDKDRERTKANATLIVTAVNEWEALRDVEMSARDLSDAMRSGDTQMRLNARLNMDKALAHLNTLRQTQ